MIVPPPVRPRISSVRGSPRCVAACLLATLCLATAGRAGAATHGGASAALIPFDANCDQRVDQADVQAVVDIILGAPNTCETADANGDGRISVADTTAILMALGAASQPTPTETPTGTASAPPTSSATVGSPTRTPTRTVKPTITRTPTRTPTSRPTGTGTRTPTVTRTPPNTRPPTATTTRSVTRSATATRTTTRTPTSTRTATISPTATPTRTFTATRTPTRTRTRTPTPTITPTATITRTRTPTLPPGSGPVITFFGLTTAFNSELKADTTDDLGRPVYLRTIGAAFFIVVEVKPAPVTGSRPPGSIVFNSDPNDPSARPDFQILSNRDLGNGSAAVCDKGPVPSNPLGGVPGFNPLDFDPLSQAVADALNDFGCRFDVHTQVDPCTNDDAGNPAFLGSGTTLQYCTATVVGAELHFPPGDTVLTVQVRDSGGHLGFPATLVVRVSPPQ